LVLETLDLQGIQHFQLPGNTLADYLPYPENIRKLSDLFPILWQQILQEEIDNLIRRIREVIRV
jgi:hypothetical protein